MTNFHIKSKAHGYVAWMEVWKDNDWCVACEANILMGINQVLVDTIDTPFKMRRKGYATQLVNKIKEKFNCEVLPIGILNTDEAKSFWNKLGLEDALGEER